MTVHDEALASKIRTALNSDKRVSNLPISVRVSGDQVFLKGRVESLDQVDVVQFLASGIPGVRYVDVSELEVPEGTK